MKTVGFEAFEYQTDATLKKVPYRFEGSSLSGWKLFRDGTPHLDLPPGYRLLQTDRCGICATDLDRHFLPFALPQITGHEVVAKDDDGRLVTAEINASHLSTGSDQSDRCLMCSSGLPSHCPERLVLGIDRLPGGFSPWILVPEGNIVPLPAAVPPDIGVLIEPFAAAWHACRRITIQAADRIAVLGSGRLGLLIIAALYALRQRTGTNFVIEAVGRNPQRLALAEKLGADSGRLLGQGHSGRGLAARSFNVVFEATGSQQGLAAACRLASREVHVKSTTGQETLGLRHLTEMVVDEIALSAFEPEGGACLERAVASGGKAVILGKAAVPGLETALTGAGYRLLSLSLDGAGPSTLEQGILTAQADIVVADSTPMIDYALRPVEGTEHGLVRPRGQVLVTDTGEGRDELLEAILGQRITLTTSRCGEFLPAMAAMETLIASGIDLSLLVEARMSIKTLPAAFEQARAPGTLKVIVHHES